MPSQGSPSRSAQYDFTLFYGVFSLDGEDLLTPQLLEYAVSTRMAKAILESTTPQGETLWNHPGVFHNIYVTAAKDGKGGVDVSAYHELAGRPSTISEDFCVTRLDLYVSCTYVPQDEGSGYIQLPVTKVRVQTPCTFLNAVKRACTVYGQSIPLQVRVTNTRDGDHY
jgi:hypothetical protein